MKNNKTKTNKTESKTEPNLTVNNKNDLRNIASYANKLLKGIDNDTASVKRDQENINRRIDRVNENLVNLTKAVNAVANAAISNSVPAATKTAEKKPVANTSAKVVKTQDKPAKTTKLASKPVSNGSSAKKAAKKAAKVATVSVEHQNTGAVKAAPKIIRAVEERPALKTVIDRILAGKTEAIKASYIYNEACKLHGQWSRQSLYNALKDTNRYVRVGDGVEASYKLITKVNTVTEDETEKMITRVESAAVANVL
jgi:hypothetical protein